MRANSAPSPKPIIAMESIDEDPRREFALQGSSADRQPLRRGRGCDPLSEKLVMRTAASPPTATIPSLSLALPGSAKFLVGLLLLCAQMPVAAAVDFTTSGPGAVVDVNDNSCVGDGVTAYRTRPNALSATIQVSNPTHPSESAGVLYTPPQGFDVDATSCDATGCGTNSGTFIFRRRFLCVIRTPTRGSYGTRE